MTKLYNKRTWLNDIKSSSSSSIVTFDGDVEYSDKTYRDIFVKIYDCKNSITLHRKESESMKEFTQKLELLKKEIESFITHLKNKRDENNRI